MNAEGRCILIDGGSVDHDVPGTDTDQRHKSIRRLETCGAVQLRAALIEFENRFGNLELQILGVGRLDRVRGCNPLRVIALGARPGQGRCVYCGLERCLTVGCVDKVDGRTCRTKNCGKRQRHHDKHVAGRVYQEGRLVLCLGHFNCTPHRVIQYAINV